MIPNKRYVDLILQESKIMDATMLNLILQEPKVIDDTIQHVASAQTDFQLRLDGIPIHNEVEITGKITPSSSSINAIDDDTEITLEDKGMTIDDRDVLGVTSDGNYLLDGDKG